MAQGNTRLENIFYESHPTGGVPGLNTITYSLWYDPSTGNYEAKQTGVAGFAIFPATLLVNGSFTSDAIRDPLLFTNNDVNQPTAKAKEVLLDAKTKVYAAYDKFGKGNKGNKINSSALPANQNTFLVNNAAAGTNPGIASALGGPLALPPGQGNPLFGSLDIKLEEYGTSVSKMKELFPNELKYPLDIIDLKQDILKITQFTYSAPYGDVFKGIQNDEIFKGGSNNPGVQRQSALKEKIQSLILPIPNNVADSNGVNWGAGDEMSAMNMAAVGNVGAVAGAGLAAKLSSLAAGAFGKKDLADILASDQMTNVAGMIALGAINNPSTGAAIQSLILKKSGFDISPETILSRGYGVVANSNLELLFSGPILRGFQFSYVFSPRSVEEAKMCRNIIRYFKQGMAAKKKNSTGYGAASFFLATPNVFKLEYLTTDSKGARTSIEGLNKFKICALSGMNVSYADGQWSAFEKGQPVRMQLSLNFKELEPVYESDYQETQSSGFKLNSVEGKDQDPVLPNDVGF